MSWELSRPLGLALLGLLAPLLLLYVLRVRRARRVVPSTWLWQAVERDLLAERPFRRLQRHIPLFLEALALIALALALSGPTIKSQRLPEQRVVLVLDVSASMAVREADGTRLELAKRQAIASLSRLQPGSEIMLLAAAREPELVTPFERDRRRLESAIRRLTVREVEGQLGRSVSMAADQLRQRGGGRVLLFSDGAAADREARLPLGFPVSFVRVGDQKENTAIVRSQVSRTRDPGTGRERTQVFALLVHYGSHAREVFVTLSQRNVEGTVASRRIRLEPGQRTPVELGFETAAGDAGQGLTLALSPPDAMSSDDRAHARVPMDPELPVVVAPKSASPWVQRALAADLQVRLFRADVEGLTREAVPDDALVVLDGVCPARLPGADLLIFNPPEGPCRTLQVGNVDTEPQVTSWAETDARLRFSAFEGLRVVRSRNLKVDSPRNALLRSQNGVLIADASSEGRTATVVGFDVGESNWPLRASFVLFLRNITELSRAHRNVGAQSIRTGEPIALRVPFDVEKIQVATDAGSSFEVPAHQGVAVIPAPGQVGFLHVSYAGARSASLLLPTNLNSEAESQIAPQQLEFADTGGRLDMVANRGLVDLDWIFGLLALLAISLDVAYLTRKPRYGSNNSPPRAERYKARRARQPATAQPIEASR